MIVEKGDWRLVLVCPRLGLVFKFPRIYVFMAWDNAQAFIEKNGWKRGLKLILFRKIMPIHLLPMSALFYGFLANWREFCFYLSNRPPFCMPTYLSLFGVVNVQRYGQKIDVGEFSFREQMKLLIPDAFNTDNHHWTRRSNFCRQGECIAICDYGSLRTQAIILEHGEAIRTKFDLNYIDPGDREGAG